MEKEDGLLTSARCAPATNSGTEKRGKTRESPYIDRMAMSAEPLESKLPAYVWVLLPMIVLLMMVAGVIVSVLIGVNPYIGAAVTGAVTGNVFTWRVAVWERNARRILQRVTS